MKLNPNRKCFVPGCNSGYAQCEDKFSLFKAPLDDELRQKWSKTINRENRTLTSRDVVCERHFEPSDIIRCTEIVDVTLPNKAPRLKKDAVPKYFFSGTMKREFSDIKPKKKSNAADKSWFHKIYAKEVIMSLDWGTFAIKNCEGNAILFSKMFLTDNIPIMERQMILHEDLTASYFIGKNEIERPIRGLPSKLTEESELKSAIEHFSIIKLCSGGPACYLYNDLIKVTDSAHIDYSTGLWRHNKCPLVLGRSKKNSCVFCYSLPNRFARLRQFHRNRKEQKRSVSQSVIKKRKITIVKKNRHLNTQLEILKASLQMLKGRQNENVKPSAKIKLIKERLFGEPEVFECEIECNDTAQYTFYV